MTTRAALRGAAALSIAATMPVVTAIAAPAAAAPPSSVADRPSLETLEQALITEKEAPEGYSLSFRFVTTSALVPAESADPCASEVDTTDVPGGSASVAYQKGADGPTVSESLNLIGAEAAGKAVERYRAVLERCPVTEDESARTTVTRWSIPQAGDDSIAVLVTTEPKDSEEGSSRVAMAVIAHGDVMASFTKVDATEQENADLGKFIEAGVQKLQKTW
ncbi:hypothetical protein [Actinoplanes teichomyceticus]|uniref:hypothetical protein n=1 Tax=Actinoplanes teichomyceticus TaxID=1867 RepID=UPI000F0A45F2|nr:hypothetical protein [Actinoplanes teichomyceticus]GIF16371.1 hypothetical protein Ate01nite_64030 [Actinoplanes teichomyceticus]